jgi:hypothetical protein
MRQPQVTAAQLLSKVVMEAFSVKHGWAPTRRSIGVG